MSKWSNDAPSCDSSFVAALPPDVHRLQIAPMIDVSYRDFRYFMRLFSTRSQVWTEMVADKAVNHSQHLDHLLGFDSREHPIVCQVGGSDPQGVADAAHRISTYGYDEINLNVGCPSCRVANAGGFGAELIKQPKTVHDVMRSMDTRVNDEPTSTGLESLYRIHESYPGLKVPVSVKTRLGVDQFDSDQFFGDFLDAVGCSRVVLHCRKAWLQGLSPAENRFVPPLNYDRGYKECGRRGGMKWWLNGGIRTLWQAADVMNSPSAPENLEGVMIGRGAMNTPSMLWDADRYLYGEDTNPATAVSRRSVLEHYIDYLHDRYPVESDATSSTGTLHLALKPTLGLFSGLPGQKKYRAAADTFAKDKALRGEVGVGGVVELCMKAMPDEVLDLPFKMTEDVVEDDMKVIALEEYSAGAAKREEQRLRKQREMEKKCGMQPTTQAPVLADAQRG